MALKILINHSRCDLCGLCIKYCPTYVFYMKDDKVEADPSKCIECYGCIPLCPKEAIEIVSDDP